MATVLALGGSTNAVIHLIAMAGRCGVPLSLDDFDEISRRVPVLANVRPSGKYLMEDFYYAGGLRALLAQLAEVPGALHPDRITVTGRTLAEQLAGAQVYNDDVIRTPPPRWRRGRAGRAARQSGAGRRRDQAHRGRSCAAQAHRARPSCSTATSRCSSRSTTRRWASPPDSVLVLRNAGPLGGPGMPEYGMLPIPDYLLAQGVRDMVRISDARMSGTSYGACVLHVAPESYAGGPLALVRTGDPITLDVPERIAPAGRGRRPSWPAAGPRGGHRRPGSSAATARCTPSRSPRPTRAVTSSSWPGPAATPSPTPADRSDPACRPARRVVSSTMPTILITGAAGQIGSMLRPRLARPGRTLRLLDMRAARRPAGPGEEVVVASATDMAAMTKACAGADAVIHLAGIAGEAPWERILETNIQGTYTAFEAARRAGVPRVIFASSNHAVGFTPRSAFPVPDYAFPAPDTYYGVSKVTGEALAAQYHHRYGLDTICLRILSCFERPQTARMLSTWLSPDDAGRLFEACLTAERPGFRVAFGVSANTRGGLGQPGRGAGPGLPARGRRGGVRGRGHRRAWRTGPVRSGPRLPGRGVHPPGMGRRQAELTGQPTREERARIMIQGYDPRTGKPAGDPVAETTGSAVDTIAAQAAGAFGPWAGAGPAGGPRRWPRWPTRWTPGPVSWPRWPTPRRRWAPPG